MPDLRTLQAFGQAPSAGLVTEDVVSAICEQIARLMPAPNFHVSLYDPEIDEVSFPLAVEDGERVPWRSRRTGLGLTEYVPRTRDPLLIRGDVEATLERLGITSIGQPAECWLGVTACQHRCRLRRSPSLRTNVALTDKPVRLGEVSSFQGAGAP